jgi:hypothetical protein
VHIQLEAVGPRFYSCIKGDNPVFRAEGRAATMGEDERTTGLEELHGS